MLFTSLFAKVLATSVVEKIIKTVSLNNIHHIELIRCQLIFWFSCRQSRHIAVAVTRKSRGNSQSSPSIHSPDISALYGLHYTLYVTTNRQIVIEWFRSLLYAPKMELNHHFCCSYACFTVKLLSNIGATGGTRTLTFTILSRIPLPIGIL